MSDPQQLDRELREYLDKEPNLRREDRLSYLKTIFNKHLEFNKLEHVVNYKDFGDIVDGAKKSFAGFSLPMNITRKRIDGNELTQAAMIESTVSYLNKMLLLKKSVKLDITE